MSEGELFSRVVIAERRLRVAYIIMFMLILVVSALGFCQAWAFHRLAHPETLTLRRLNIVDDHGVSRVILAAPAPEPMVLGKQHHRDAPVSGLIIADASGTERGGYVTADGYANAMLTLDAQGKQTVLLLAEPSGNTLFRLWDRNGEDVTGSLTMGVSDKPFLNEKQGGSIVFSAPENNPQSRYNWGLFK
jgi:hypothetical protein